MLHVLVHTFLNPFSYWSKKSSRGKLESSDTDMAEMESLSITHCGGKKYRKQVLQKK